MRFRTLALALALTCAATGLAEAKRPVAVHNVNKRAKTAKRVKTRKFKNNKASAKAARRRAKRG